MLIVQSNLVTPVLPDYLRIGASPTTRAQPRRVKGREPRSGTTTAPRRWLQRLDKVLAVVIRVSLSLRMQSHPSKSDLRSLPLRRRSVSDGATQASRRGLA